MGDTDYKVLDFDEYKEQFALPVYFVIQSKEKSNVNPGDRYLVRVEEDDSWHYIHKAVVASVAHAQKMDNVPPEILGMAAETDSKNEMIRRLGEYISSGAPLEVCAFMREELAEEFVANGLDAVDANASEDAITDSIATRTDKDINSAVAKQEILEGDEE